MYIIAKPRSYFPSKHSNLVLTVFFFRTQVDFFNIFFQKSCLKRMDKDCRIACITQEQHNELLDCWARSLKSDDTIFDSMLPYPNTKKYVWSNSDTNEIIHQLRMEQHDSRNKGRPNFRPKHKQSMLSTLSNVDHYVIEIREDTFERCQATLPFVFTHKFEMNTDLRSAQLNNINYDICRRTLQIHDAIKCFAISFEKIQSHPASDGTFKYFMLIFLLS